MGFLRVLAEVLAMLWLIVQMVERPGEGQQKKEEALAKFREWLDLAKDRLPGWLYDYLYDGPAAGFIIDTLVWVANRLGFFRTSSPTTSSVA